MSLFGRSGAFEPSTARVDLGSRLNPCLLSGHYKPAKCINLGLLTNDQVLNSNIEVRQLTGTYSSFTMTGEPPAVIYCGGTSYLFTARQLGGPLYVKAGNPGLQ